MIAFVWGDNTRCASIEGHCVPKERKQATLN